MSHNFSPQTRFEWKKMSYKVTRRFEDDTIELINLTTTRVITVTKEELVAAFFAGELWFEVAANIAKPADPNSLNVKYEYIGLDDVKEADLELAKLRHKAIEPLLGVKCTKQLLADRVEEIRQTWSPADLTKLKGLSLRSLERWKKAWKDSGGNLRSLIDRSAKSGGKGKSRKKAVDAYIQQAFENVGPNESITAIAQEVEKLLDDAKKDPKTAPNVGSLSVHRSTVGRRLKNAKNERSNRNRLGDFEADKREKQRGNFEELDFPHDRVEFDGTKTDLIIVDDADDMPMGRLTLIFAIDVVTRVILGYFLGFEPESWWSVAECAYNAFSKKPSPISLYGTHNEIPCLYGLPHSAATDHGKAFENKHAVDAFTGLGIRTDRVPKLSGESKPFVESLNRTVELGLFHIAPGTTFSNILQRGNYSSEKEACVYLSKIDKALNIWSYDIYSQTPHGGLKGDKPANAWMRFLDAGWEPRFPPNNEMLSILLGRVEYRALTKDGIFYETLQFNSHSSEVVALRKALGKDNIVKFKFHPGDLGAIWVYNPFTNEYLMLPALDQEYAKGLSLWKHLVIKKQSREIFDKADGKSLAEARRRLREMFAEGGAHINKARGKTDGRRSSDFADIGSTGMMRPEEIASSDEIDNSLPEIVTELDLNALFAKNQALADEWQSSQVETSDDEESDSESDEEP